MNIQTKHTEETQYSNESALANRAYLSDPYYILMNPALLTLNSAYLANPQ
jgi:hypothetical protein